MSDNVDEAIEKLGPAELLRATPMGRKTWSLRLLAAALMAAILAAYWLLAVSSVRHKSQTFDETVHLTAGYAYGTFQDFRLQPENGNLPQRWVTLPLLRRPEIRFPNRDQPDWQRSNAWAVGDQFCHRLGNDLESMLRSARSFAALLGVAVCLTVFVWSRRIFGTLGGFVSLALAAFCPTMLAHGPLATSDMCAALCFTLTVACLWRVFEQVSLSRVLISAVVTGALFLSKVSAVLIVPMALLMLGAQYFLRRRLVLSWRGRTREVASGWGLVRVALLIAGTHVAVSFQLVWWAYGWRYSAAPAETAPPSFYKFETLLEAARRAGTAGGLLYSLGEHRLLPEAYLYGAAFTLAHRQRASFLNGEYSLRGWPHYFPYCAMVKTPLALFGLLLAALAWDICQHRTARRDPTSGGNPSQPLVGRFIPMVPLFVLLLVYWAAAIASSINIGHRHLLPTYPAMFILAGGSARWISRAHWRAAAVVLALLLAFLAESARAYPHYLAYFNPLLPRERAYRHLVESNLDWGQDLPGLKQWLNEHAAQIGRQPVYLAYFGTGSPRYYGIQALELPVMEAPRDIHPLQSGVYCLSATALANVHGEAPGRWNQTYERTYQAARSAARQQVVDAEFELASDEDRRAFSVLLYWLRIARLYAYLRSREPSDHVGYSILIFHVSDEDIQAALEGPPLELDQKSWREREESR